MVKLSIENSAAIIAAAQELEEAGQLWVSLDGEEVYIPELIEQLQSLIELDNTKKSQYSHN